MSVVYLAYDTNHGFSLYHNATNLNTIDWKQKIHLVELKFPYIIDYTPQAAIYLNGANFELGNSYTLKLHI